jgi:hypothetical protein
LEQWAFATDQNATTVSSEFNNFFYQSITARFGNLNASNHRSASDQVMDAIRWRLHQRRRHLNWYTSNPLCCHTQPITHSSNRI